MKCLGLDQGSVSERGLQFDGAASMWLCLALVESNLGREHRFSLRFVSRHVPEPSVERRLTSLISIPFVTRNEFTLW